MTGLVRKATLLSACGLLLAGAAMAGIPNAANSQKPCVILMDSPNSPNNVGVNPGVCGQPALLVIVRDALNAPVDNSDVVLDFSACSGTNTGGTCLSATCAADNASDPNVTEACAGRTFLKTSNPAGEVCFSLEGATNVVDMSSGHSFYTGLANRNLGPQVGQVCCKIYASGNLLGTVKVIVNKYDLDANGTVDAGDGSYHINAQGADLAGPGGGGGYWTFGDYNCDNFVDAGDGSLHIAAQGNELAGEVVYTGTYCP